MTVIPYFELHIRPMFRILDRDHMAFKLDLWDYDQVTPSARKIAGLLRLSPPGLMPPKEAGGPWPEGWIQTFEFWIEKGCPRLLLTEGQYSARRIGSGQVILSVSVQLADWAADSWSERVPSPRTEAEYLIYLRPPQPGAGEPPRLVQLKEVLPAQTEKVFISDSSGRHEIPISS
jgi:hypothetical protein